MSGAVSHAQVSEALDRAYALALELGTEATAVADAIDGARALHLRAVGTATGLQHDRSAAADPVPPAWT